MRTLSGHRSDAGLYSYMNVNTKTKLKMASLLKPSSIGKKGTLGLKRTWSMTKSVSFTESIEMDKDVSDLSNVEKRFANFCCSCGLKFKDSSFCFCGNCGRKRDTV
jgi:hypothetical protein